MGHQSTSMIQINTRNNSKHTQVCHHFLSAFLLFFFKVCGFDKRLVTSTEAHTWFSLTLFFFIDICYGSLSQYVLRHHTGERRRGRKRERGRERGVQVESRAGQRDRGAGGCWSPEMFTDTRQMVKRGPWTGLWL